MACTRQPGATQYCTEATALAERVAALENVLRPFADYAAHVPDDGDATVARREYGDGTFAELYGDQFHEAAALLR